MSKALLAKSEQIAAKHKGYVEMPGSPYHPKSVEKTGRRLDGRHESEPTIDKDLIAFSSHGKDRYYYFLVGEHAKRAFDACKKLNESYKVVYGCPSDEVKAATLFPELALETKDGVPCLRVQTAQWNDFLKAMSMQNPPIFVTESSTAD